MRVLTDCRSRLDEFFPTRTMWLPAAPPELPPVDRALWQAAGGRSAVWAAECGSDDFWTRAAIVEDASCSPFDKMRELLLDAPLPEPVVCLALEGHGFHGHRGRPWVAGSGNLHLTVAFSPHLPSTQLVPTLTMLPAVAVVAAIRRATGEAVRPGIKWVNDILVEGEKIAGVFTGTQALGPTIESVVFGISLNVEQAPEVASTPFVPRVGCLRRSCAPEPPPALATLFWLLLDEVAAHATRVVAEDDGQVFRDYVQASLVIGKRVCVWPEEDDVAAGSTPVRGVVESIAPDLSLRLGGHPEPVRRGRLTLE